MVIKGPQAMPERGFAPDLVQGRARSLRAPSASTGGDGDGRVPRAQGELCRVLVTGDSPLFCESLARLLLNAPGLFATHSPLERAVEAAIDAEITLLLLNCDAYRKQLVEVVESIRQTWPAARVLVLVKTPAQWCDRMVAEIGALGWLTRHVRADYLIKAVLGSHRDIRVAPDRVFGGAGQRRTAEALLLEQLTDRETEVLRLLSTGQRGDYIATRLEISPNTVRTHIQNIIVKLGVHTRLEAVAFARRNGLLPSSHPSAVATPPSELGVARFTPDQT